MNSVYKYGDYFGKQNGGYSHLLNSNIDFPIQNNIK